MRKTTLIISLCFFIVSLTFAQVTPITVKGQVTDKISGLPVTFKNVYIYTDSNITWNYSNVVVTDSSGNYSKLITPPAGKFFKFNVFVMDCNNNTIDSSFQNTASLFTINFSICTSVAPACKADFYYYMTGSPKKTAAFFDNSTGNIKSWFWEFGDGTNSSATNPVHTFPAKGVYWVTLVINGTPGCSDSITQQVNITDSSSCNAYFTYQQSGKKVTFEGYSSDSASTTTYSWDFGDSTTGTGANPSHTYLTNSTVYVCLNTVSINSTKDTCMASYCGYVTFTFPTYSVMGSVSSPSYKVDNAIVYLIYYNPLDSTLTAIDTMNAIDSAGTAVYYFGNIPEGKYLIKAALTSKSSNYSHCMPAYYGNVLYWSSATYVNLDSLNTFPTVNISLITGTNPGGPGFIGGKTSQGANSVYTVGDPVQAVEILLIDNSTGSPVAFSYSDEVGDFGFSALAYGTYRVYAEIPGKTTIPPIVTISSANPSVDNVGIIIDTKIITGIFDNRVAGSLNNYIMIYPVPASTAINVKITLYRKANVSVNITNAAGQNVYHNQDNYTSGNHDLNINVKNLVPGLYNIQFKTEDGSFVNRNIMIVR